jgi:hypothetical protein
VHCAARARALARLSISKHPPRDRQCITGSITVLGWNSRQSSISEVLSAIVCVELKLIRNDGPNTSLKHRDTQTIAAQHASQEPFAPTRTFAKALTVGCKSSRLPI